MTSETELRQKLREWVATNAKNPPAQPLTDQTKIIEERIITSVQVLDLILFMERIGNSAIEVEQLKPGSFKDIDTIYQTFFGASNGK